MTDPHRRAVEAIDSWFKSSYKNLGYGNEILARVRAADLVILDRQTVRIVSEHWFSTDTTSLDIDELREAHKAIQEALGDGD